MPGNRGFYGVSETPRVLSPAWAPDLGAAQLLTRPKIINPEDDMFDGPTLDPKWIPMNFANQYIDFKELPGWLRLRGAILQPVPAGDWYCETEVLMDNIWSTGYDQSGLVLSSGLSGSTTQHWFDIGMLNSATTGMVDSQKMVNWSYNALHTQWGHYGILNKAHLLVQKIGSTYYDYISTTGKTWCLIWTGSLSFTPAYFGLYTASFYPFYNYFIRR